MYSRISQVQLVEDSLEVNRFCLFIQRLLQLTHSKLNKKGYSEMLLFSYKKPPLEVFYKKGVYKIFSI